MPGNLQFDSGFCQGFARAVMAGVRAALTMSCVMGTLIGAPDRAGSAETPSEYQVKAAFLYNFAKFVEWPSPPQSAIELCVMGEDPFGNAIEDTVRGKTINGQPLVVRRIKPEENPRSCQIAFIGAPGRESRAVLESLRGASTLTVGDSPNFARDGGIINFILRDNKVHFEINVDAAEQARLKISSKLLNLAKIIRN